MLPRLPGHDADFTFELTGNRGAALVTRNLTYPEDTELETAFETYTKRHYNSWVEFARHKQVGDKIHPILVSGFDMTRDFSTVVYSNEDALTSHSAIPIQMFRSTPPTFKGTWRASFPVDTNEGLQRRSSSLGGRSGVSFRHKPNQCVFIRYYTMRWRNWFSIYGDVVRGGAGSPRSDNGDTGSGSDTARNPPQVWFLLFSSVSTLNFAPRWNMTAGMPLEITYSE